MASYQSSQYVNIGIIYQEKICSSRLKSSCSQSWEVDIFKKKKKKVDEFATRELLL